MASSDASQVTVASLPRLSAGELSDILLKQGTESLNLKDDIAIIDVRDDDHIGGHIRNSIHVPSSTHATALPSLVHKLRDKPVVVFHCALSQVRGPKAALQYVRERERLVGPGTTGVVADVEDTVPQTKGKGVVGEMLKRDREEQLRRQERGVLRHEAEEGEGWEDLDREGEVVGDNGGLEDETNAKTSGKQKQRVMVLAGGFTEWQAVYGEDERLTEGYSKALWEDSY